MKGILALFPNSLTPFKRFLDRSSMFGTLRIQNSNSIWCQKACKVIYNCSTQKPYWLQAVISVQQKLKQLQQKLKQLLLDPELI